MTDGSTPLTNAKHENFAHLMAGGEVPVAEAYRRCVRARCAEAMAQTAGLRLAQTAAAQARITWLQGQAGKAPGEGQTESPPQPPTEKPAETGTILTLMEKRSICAEIARGGEKAADRLRAIQVDNDLAGDGSEATGHHALEDLANKLRL